MVVGGGRNGAGQVVAVTVVVVMVVVAAAVVVGARGGWVMGGGGVVGGWLWVVGLGCRWRDWWWPWRWWRWWWWWRWECQLYIHIYIYIYIMQWSIWKSRCIHIHLSIYTCIYERVAQFMLIMSGVKFIWCRAFHTRTRKCSGPLETFGLCSIHGSILQESRSNCTCYCWVVKELLWAWLLLLQRGLFVKLSKEHVSGLCMGPGSVTHVCRLETLHRLC